MLEDIIERTKEAADSYLLQPHARINGVQIGPVGIDWTYAQEAQGNWRTRMNGIFKQLENMTSDFSSPSMKSQSI
ncbi:MAG: hypothetical protein ACLTXI_05250 [Collinsella sp.]